MFIVLGVLGLIALTVAVVIPLTVAPGHRGILFLILRRKMVREVKASGWQGRVSPEMVGTWVAILRSNILPGEVYKRFKKHVGIGKQKAVFAHAEALVWMEQHGYKGEGNKILHDGYVGGNGLTPGVEKFDLSGLMQQIRSGIEYDIDIQLLDQVYPVPYPRRHSLSAMMTRTIG